MKEEEFHGFLVLFLKPSMLCDDERGDFAQRLCLREKAAQFGLEVWRGEGRVILGSKVLADNIEHGSLGRPIHGK